MLKEFGGIVELNDWWARGILTKLNCSKRKGTTGKLEPSPQFLAKEKFTFRRAIAAAVSRHNILDSLVLNIDQTPLAYVSPGKYTFSSKCTKMSQSEVQMAGGRLK